MVGLFLDWIGLDWIGLDWIGLDWIGLDCAGVAFRYRAAGGDGLTFCLVIGRAF